MIRISMAIIAITIAALFACANPAANILNTTAVTPGNSPQAKIDLQPTPAPAPVLQINKNPKSLVEAFYEFYLDGSPTMEGNEVIFMRFLTPRFYDEAEKIDAYDPFLDAQEGDETWKDNIKVSNVVVRGSKATLIVLLDGKEVKWKAKLTLVKKNGTWKIDAINMAVR